MQITAIATCPHCKQGINIEDLTDGVEFDCPQCGSILRLDGVTFTDITSEDRKHE